MGGEEPWRTRAHYDGSPVVVIAFEGTGAFDDRRPKLMQEMGRRLQAQGVDTTDDKFSPAPLLDAALSKERGHGANWSGLHSGPLTEVVKDPKLNSNIQYMSFPSEEVESENFSLNQLGRDIRRSSSGTSQGIEAARERMREIAEDAKRQGKSPKFVLMSHSSGGRSSVKFAEKMKGEINPATGKPFEFALSMSIDPVREAHEAAGEVIGKKVVSFLNPFDWSPETPTVDSQKTTREPLQEFQCQQVGQLLPDFRHQGHRYGLWYPWQPRRRSRECSSGPIPRQEQRPRSNRLQRGGLGEIQRRDARFTG